MRVVTFGEALGVLAAREVGPFELGDSIRMGTGGAEANVAIGLARLGVPVTWCGVVGDDPIGRRVVREMRGEGVQVRHRVDGSRFTALLLKERPQSGHTRITYYRAGSAGSTLSAADVDDAVLDEACILHVSGITSAISEGARRAMREIVRRARERGITVSFDVNHRGQLWTASAAAPVYHDIIAHADIVFGGLDEARIVLGDDTLSAEQALPALRALGPSSAVIKLGPEGAIADAAGEIVRARGISVNVVDTVGAGDAFVAGYLSRHLRAPGDVADALRTACVTGAAVCRSGGDWESAARPEDIDTLARGGDPDVR